MTRTAPDEGSLMGWNRPRRVREPFALLTKMGFVVTLRSCGNCICHIVIHNNNLEKLVTTEMKKWVLLLVALILFSATAVGKGSDRIPAGPKAEAVSALRCPNPQRAREGADIHVGVSPRQQRGTGDGNWAATARQCETDTIEARRVGVSGVRHRNE